MAQQQRERKTRAPERGNSTQKDESQRQQHAEQIEGLQRIIQSQVIRLEEKDQSVAQKDETIEAKLQEIKQLRQHHREEIQQVEREKNRSIENLKGQLERVTSEVMIAEGQLYEPELQVSWNNPPHPELRSRKENRDIKIIWGEGKKAPCER